MLKIKPRFPTEMLLPAHNIFVSRGKIDVNYFKSKIVVEYSVNIKSVTKTGIFRTYKY